MADSTGVNGITYETLLDDTNGFDISVVRKLWKEDLEFAEKKCDEQRAMAAKYGCKSDAKGKDKLIEKIAVTEGKVLPYLLKRVFSLNTVGYYVIENKSLEYKCDAAWSKYKSMLDVLSKEIFEEYKRQEQIYKVSVERGEYVVDFNRKFINRAPPTNYVYRPDAEVDKAKGKQILMFMKELTTSGNEDEWAIN